MRGQKAYIALQAIAYIEDNLRECLELGRVADALGYSKFHLHRLFSETVGLPLHEYVRRRRLTKAAGELVYSGETVMDIALASGYGSRQAFTDAFRAMYKAAPARFREAGKFYPLQLNVFAGALGEEPVKGGFVQGDITYAAPSDAEGWMGLARLKVDGYPYFDEAEYTENLYRYMEEKRALILRDGGRVVGILGFSGTDGGCVRFSGDFRGRGSIDFLAVHPQYRALGIEELFLGKLTEEIFPGGELSVTTYRAGDRADTGCRGMYLRLGFQERELLTEYGYPTQRFVFSPGDRQEENDDA